MKEVTYRVIKGRWFIAMCVYFYRAVVITLPFALLAGVGTFIVHEYGWSGLGKTVAIVVLLVIALIGNWCDNDF